MKSSKSKDSQSTSPSKRVAIYCRVSTIDQGKGDYSSLDTQAQLVQQYCASKGWSVYKVFTDTKSGTTLEREQLNNLLHDAQEHRFDVVAVTKLDRISRSVKDFLDLDETFTKLGIDIVVTTQNIDTTTPAGKMQRNIMLAFAEFERDMIADRTRERLYDRAQKGYWGGGNVLLGYKVVDKKLIVIEEEAALVERVFNYYLEQPSSYKIAQRLNDEGFRTKIRTTKANKVVGGAHFNSKHVQDLLNNNLYIGQVQYKDQVFKGLHQAIIGEELFNKVQELLAKSRDDRYITHDTSELVLLGIIKCGFCEKGLTTSFGKKGDKKYFYYKCTVKTKLGAGNCEERDISAEQVEGLVEKLIARLGDNDSFYNAVFKQAESNEDTTLVDLKAKQHLLKENRALVLRDISKITSFITKAPEGFDTASIYEQIKLHQESQKGIEIQLGKIEKEIEVIEQTTSAKKSLKEVYSKVGKIYGSLDKSAQRRIVRALITTIEFKYKKSEDVGEIRMGFRGDGDAVESWYRNIDLDELAEKLYAEGFAKESGTTKMLPSAKPSSRNGNKKPDNSVSSYRGLPLRG